MAEHEWISDGHYSWQEYAGLDILSMVDLHVLCAYHMTLDQGWSARDELDTRARLYYVLDGSGQLESNGHHASLQPGRIYLIPSNTTRTYSCDEHLELFWCHFSMRLRSGSGFFADAAPVMVIVPSDPAELRLQFEKLIAAFDRDTGSTVVARSGILLQLIAPFVDQVDPLLLSRRQSAVEPFRVALADIEARLHEPIDIPALAARSGMSPAHFTRLFSEAFGLPPGRHILRRRIEVAQLRLVQTDDKLETIGLDLGFCDGFHFSKTFKRITGISPSRYRRMIRQP